MEVWMINRHTRDGDMTDLSLGHPIKDAIVIESHAGETEKVAESIDAIESGDLVVREGETLELTQSLDEPKLLH
jgi:hypothetical protein